MNYIITYGTLEKNIDITKVALEKCVKEKILYIPSGDCDRASIFTDPVIGILKSIFIKDKSNNIYLYNHHQDIYIDIEKNIIYDNDNVPDNIISIHKNYFNILKNIHKKLKIEYGTFNDEFPEQLMATSNLKGSEKVLEIGANIGRNSLIIAHILNKHNNNNFVSLECDDVSVKKLETNKNINNLNFKIEPSALSKRKLIQKGWDTMCSDVLLPGYKNVNTITLEELNKKYNIVFDTLVLDCEGAFYYILQDMPEILNNIKLIIMENDYHDYSHKHYIDTVLKNNKFYVHFSQAGGWGPCQSHFFEVWKRDI